MKAFVESSSEHFPYSSPMKTPPTGRIIPLNTGSFDTLQTAHSWIANCDQKHRCKSSEKSQLPRRILDVRNGKVRLHNSASESGLYACLPESQMGSRSDDAHDQGDVVTLH
jgi:hypothetical protein